MLEKFGRSLLFIVFLIMIVIGAKMTIKVADPLTRKLSPSLADVLKSV